MIQFAVDTYGGLDILHNNGYWTVPQTIGSMLHIDDEEVKPALHKELRDRAHAPLLDLRADDRLTGFQSLANYVSAHVAAPWI